MALIAASDDQRRPVDVLACTERHYIVTDTHAFIEIDLVVWFAQPAQELVLLFDRQLEHFSSQQAESVVNARKNYKAALFYQRLTNARSDVGNEHQGVYDFQKTLRKSWTRNYGRDRNYVVQIQAPDTLNFRVATQWNLGEVFIRPSRQKFTLRSDRLEEEDHWAATTCYQVRFGFFIRYSGNKEERIRRYVRRWTYRSYRIHLFTCDQQAQNRLRDYLNALRENRLWLRMAPYRGLEPIRDLLLNPKVHSREELDQEIEQLSDGKKLDRPHSDIWIVVPREWNLHRTFSSDKPAAPVTPSGLLFDSQQDGLQEFKAHRWVPGASDAAEQAYVLGVTSGQVLELRLSPWWLYWRRIYLLVLTAISIGLGVGGFTSTLAALLVAIAVLVTYGLFAWLAARLNLPNLPD